MTLLAPERHERILDRLRRTGTITVQEIAHDLKVTKETVRRDLDQLETAGSLQRVHGGAVVSSSPSRRETSLRQRQSEHSQQKRDIARAALNFVPSSPEASLLIDAGTTTEALAELLAAPSAAEHLYTRFLITSSVPIAQKLAEVASLDVEVLGGKVRGITGAVVGAAAVAALSRRQADVAFIGTNGVDTGFGLSTPDTAEAAVKSALVQAARQVVLLADSSKLGHRTLVQFATLKEIDVLITDTTPQPAMAESLHEADVRVIVAGTQ